jgi:hypothetical protein
MHEAEMNSVNENDLELLESYLDDELTGRELEALRQRLSSEPQLAVAIDELKSQRQMRQQFFGACEPDQMSVARLVQSVNQNVTRELAWAERNRSLRSWGSLAACLLVGLFLGRAMRGTGQASAPAPHQTAVVSNPINSTPVIDRTDTPRDTRLVFDGPSVINPNSNNRPQGNFRITQPPMANVETLNPLEGYSINIVDRFGNTVRQFNSHEQYQKFIDEQMQRANQPPTPDSLRLPDGK